MSSVFLVVLLLLFCFVSFLALLEAASYTHKKQTSKQKILLKVFGALHPEVLPSEIVHSGLEPPAQERLGAVGVGPEEDSEDDQGYSHVKRLRELALFREEEASVRLCCCLPVP